MVYDKWLSRYGLQENFDTEIPIFAHELDFDGCSHPWAWTLGSDVMERKPLLHGIYGPSMSAF